MDRRLWGLESNADDHLVLGGCDLVTLAATYGTPLHVVDEGRLRGNYRRFLAAFQGSYPATRVFYSYKTNCIPGVLALLHEEGCGAEVISPYEAWLACRLGVKGANTVYNGVARSTDDFRLSIERRSGLINVDSLDELRRLAEAAEGLQQTVNVGFRIYPRVGWRAHFGLHPQADRLVSQAAALRGNRYLNLCALHVHIGSAVRGTHLYERVIEILCSLIRDLRTRAGADITCLDLGGGFGSRTVKRFSVPEMALYRLLDVAPRPPRPDDCPTVEAFGQMLTAVLRDRCARDGLPEPELFLEPGRAITGDAQVLLLSVKEVKRRGGRTAFAMVDGGMQNIAFPLAYEYHHALVASRAGAPRHQRYFIAGPLCSPEDVLYRNWALPAVTAGDVLAVMDAGAYFTSFANNFSYPRPSVVGVADGRHRLLRDRETFEQMTRVDGL